MGDGEYLNSPVQSRLSIRRLSKPIRRMTLQFTDQIRNVKSILKNRKNSQEVQIESLQSMASSMRKSVIFKSVSNIEVHPSFINFENGSVLRPPEGVINSLISSGQFALCSQNKMQSTYSFHGWKIEDEHFFLEKGRSLVCLGMTRDLNWILEATCEDLYRNDNGLQLHGIIFELSRIFPTKQMEVKMLPGKSVVSILPRDGEGLELTPLSTSFEAETWSNLIQEDPIKLSEMKIEIIRNNFDKHMMDHVTCMFLRADSERIVPSPSEAEYTYSYLSGSEYEYEIENLPQQSGVFGPNEQMPSDIYRTDPPELFSDSTTEL